MHHHLRYQQQQQSFESTSSSPESSEAENSAGTSTVVSEGSAELLKASTWSNPAMRGPPPADKAVRRGSMHIPFTAASADAALPVPLPEHAKRASRYLYDVPTTQQPRRISRASRSLFDQHKIYDIYEESLWHSANIARPMTASAHPGFPNADDVEQKRNKAAMHPASPWNLIRSLKFQNSVGRTKHTRPAWADGDSCSLFSQHSITSDQAAAAATAEKSPKRLHELVRRAGLGILRRSVSFCKTISGSRLHTDDSPLTDESKQGSPVPPRTARKRPSLLANTLYSAKAKIRGTLGKRHTKIPNEAEDSQAQSAPSSELLVASELFETLEDDLESSESCESLLSSPVMTAPANSGASSSSDTVGEIGRSYNASRYFPPKRPSFLGLRRMNRMQAGELVAEEVKEDMPAVLLPPPVSSRISALRKAASISKQGTRHAPYSSPFMTLPYGSISQK
ncbi:hypothetical protein FBU59_004834 [Linderina macrospora]|uniref:Uncharacterized protein n=1 Tax=Linderina macrospora TaxID=4868 RepID=A0ACC1J4K8_9FUNG|nr:hypothetical protein FBU59_004834 [Linderina macrospora]